MLRILPFVLSLALWVWAFIDCVITPREEVRHLPKMVWLMIVLLFPDLGSIAWLILGRRRNWLPGPAGGQPGGGRPVAPDDDPEFLASLKRDDSGHEEMLKRWEADLRRREEELRHRDDPEDGPRG